MGRVIRKVPAKWEHPKRVNDHSGKEEFRPMDKFDYKESHADWKKELAEWLKEYKEWEAGEFKETKYTKGCVTYEDYAGEPPSPPNPYGYMPEGKWYQLFENVSEGTPLSPPFKTKEELVEWLANNKDYWGEQWTREQAEAIVKKGFALSGVAVGGKFYNARESLLID